jgi:hypothetical protein
MDRRGFIGAILATACAPAIVRAESLMRIRPIVMPTLSETFLITGIAGGEVSIHPTFITSECMKILEGHLKLDAWNSSVSLHVGDVITISRPARFVKVGGELI